MIVTVTIMILLSLIAVGLISLSSTVLRSSQASLSMIEARGNARLALNLAIGELQKQAGPDTRVTARADVLGSNVANPLLTGVWESRYLDPSDSLSASDFSSTAKEELLLTWLASGSPTQDEVSNGFAQAPLDNAVTLWDTGSLGTQATDLQKVQASLVTLSEERGAGGYAWAVLDEGVKARINTLTDVRNRTEAEKMSQLGSGVRPKIESIPGLSGFEADDFLSGSEENPDELPDKAKTLASGITFGNFGLVAEQLGDTDSDVLKSRYHDISLFSTGILTDTSRGGLKTDFNLFSSQTSLPQLYNHDDAAEVSLADKGVYETLLGISSAADTSSPRWNSLFQFARLHEDGVTVSEDTPSVEAAVPSDWEATAISRGRDRTEGANPTPPEELVLMPTIANVQLIFSLVGRDLYFQPRFAPGAAPATLNRSATNMHNPQAGFFRGTKYLYDIQLLYTPVVVLHNPYNVALEFSNMSLEFHHIPFAMQIFRNGIAQSTALVPFEAMFFDNDTESKNKDKTFGMNLHDEARGRVGSANLKLLPGEVRLFSPFIPANTTYQSNHNGGPKLTWDFEASEGKTLTENLDAIPGWRGDGNGYSCDWLAGAFKLGENAQAGIWRSGLGLAVDDNIHVEMAPFSKNNSNSKFLVKMSATPAGSRVPKVVNAIEIDYGSPDTLREKILGSSNGTIRYPEDGTVSGRDIIDWGGTTIADMQNVTPIAAVGLKAKTTHGGEKPTALEQVDGRIATKPFAFAHGSVGASSADLTTEHPALHSHELDLQPLYEGTSDLVEVDGENRGNYITGHDSLNGSKFGVAYEIPLIPLQSLQTLNGANPGGSSIYLPRFAAPIGNSWAHPLLSTDTIQEPSASGSYEMFDHSFLMNVAFYDRFYFSGLGSQTGPFGDKETVADKLQEFSDKGSLGDERLTLYQPDSRSVDELQALATNTSSHEEIAAWQLMNGAFNINSTSVNAWKAMLSSTSAPDAQMNRVDPGGDQTTITDLGSDSNEDSTGASTSRISRFRVPLSRSAEQGGPEKLAYWLGPREYTETEIQTLAENIVTEIQLRGPSLSMAEFVNRQLGSGDLAQMGALQAAIDDLASENQENDLNKGFASAANAGYQIKGETISNYGFKNLEAGIGTSSQGAPAYLTQADLLTVLGNAATPRSDTFTVRGYGEARDNSGKIEARAVCEAVVQRFPEWLDSADQVQTRPPNLTSETNQKFGRRFRVVSFRWLNEDEV